MDKFIYNPHITKQENWKLWTRFRFQDHIIQPPDYWEYEIIFDYPDGIERIWSIKDTDNFMKQL